MSYSAVTGDISIENQVTRNGPRSEERGPSAGSGRAAEVRS